MIDLTNELRGSNVRLKVTGSKLTRLDLLLNKLDTVGEKLNREKPIITLVYEKEELVEKVKGTIDDAKEIVSYYNENFVISIAIRRQRNQIIIRLMNPVAKNADPEEQEKPGL